MLFSTNSAMAFSGLLCDSAIMRIAFQSSPIRSLPLSFPLAFTKAVAHRARDRFAKLVQPWLRSQSIFRKQYAIPVIFEPREPYRRAVRCFRDPCYFKTLRARLR